MEDAMWTSTLELDPAHVIPTKLLGYIWHGAYFSSIAPLQVQNLPRQPLPATNWVRVRNALAGICGSDLHLIFVDGAFNIAPAAIPGHSRSYPGHEVVGEVIEVGHDVRHLSVGDRVVLQSGPNCITAGIQQPCRSCASGHFGLCEYGVLPGPQPIGGGWSEEMLLHEQQLFRIPSDIHDMQAVLLEPSAVAVHAVLRDLPQAKDRVLIIGAGTIGLLILQVVRALAPEAEVCVMARHAFQIEQAARSGAQIIYPQDSYKEVQQATGAQLYEGMWGNKMLLGGYDVIYDTVSNSHTIHDALRWARAGSTVVMLGLNLHSMRIDLTPIWYQEINLIGSLGHGMETWPIGTSESKSTFEIAAELIQRKLIFPDKLITHSFPLSGYRNALMTAANKARNRAIKVVFDYSKQPPSVVPNVRAAARQQQRAITMPIDSRPTLPPAPDETGFSQETYQRWTEEEAPYGAPAIVDRGATADQEASSRLLASEDFAGEMPPMPDFYDEADFGSTDRVPVVTHDFENNEQDTATASAVEPAQFNLEPQFVATSIIEQEDTATFVDATSLSEVEEEHSISPEAPLPRENEPPALPTSGVDEEDETWLQSVTHPRIDEGPSWLQALSSPQKDEGEIEAVFPASTTKNEESPATQITPPATIESESEARPTFSASTQKRLRSKRKTSEHKDSGQQPTRSEEVDLAEPFLPENENQDQQAASGTTE
jgi:threonine dehydrogenase-like Zn-dependent dehydrogenase